MARARTQLGQADLAIVVVDAAATDASAVDEHVAEMLAGAGEGNPPQHLIAMNKCDLISARPVDSDYCWISATVGTGMDVLRQSILDAVAFTPGEATHTARRRHLEALAAARAALADALAAYTASASPELVAEELRIAHDALGEIVGTVTPDDLLGRIFSEFCIGK